MNPDGRPIRVLHVMKTLELGGAEKNLFNLVRAMDPSRVENHVAYSYGGGFEDPFRAAGLRLFKYSPTKHKLQSFRSVASLFKIKNFIRSCGIQLAQSHNFNAHFLAIPAAKFTGIPLIEHVHDFRYIDPETRERGRCFVTQYRHAARIRGRSDCVVVLTAQNRDYLVQKKLYPEDRIRLIRNGVPIPGGSPPRPAVREKFGIPADHAVILTPAQLIPSKNVELVLRIAPRVIREFARATFVVAGDGPLLVELKKRAAESGVGNRVRFIGFYPRTEELLAFADILLLPSYLELHSIAVLEAMSQKVPVIISRQAGCNAEVYTDGKNALLLDPYSGEGWTEAVLGLLNDPALRRRIGEEGYKLCAEKFDIGSVAKRFEDLYEELLAAQAIRRRGVLK